jgi:UDP-N-acetylmuramoyl-L-alanyl-D-glutamate--2,6-diaminopimelate ligase
MDGILRQIKKIIPKPIFDSLAPTYHYSLALVAAVIYRFPSRQIKVIAITGTKGKSSTTEILNAVLEASGKNTAVLSTIRFKIGEQSRPNLFKMTMPGRFFVQRFLRHAVDAGCEYAILETTSEAARQYRHAFIDFDALLFLNISPEHIESHGGFANYLAAKVRLAKGLEHSTKKHKILVVNADDKESGKFVDAAPSAEVHYFALVDAEPYLFDHFGLYLTFAGKNLRSHLQGVFNVYNILAALTYAETQGVSVEQMEAGLAALGGIPGRVQKIELPSHNPLAKKQKFTVVVDYAHTADSFEKVYGVFNDSQKICVLGNTGGGRDRWKRPEMAKVANDNCSHIILTNEDPYDESPRAIIEEMLPGITSTPYEIIMDRRDAIRHALSLARPGDTVLITGKGTDPYIMEADGRKLPWSDAKVAQEELEIVLGK